MVNKTLLNMLCCPETKEDVELVTGELVEKINRKIAEGQVKSRGGEQVTETIDSGLMRKDKKYLYPVREDIPVMLIDEAIPLDSFI